MQVVPMRRRAHLLLQLGHVSAGGLSGTLCTRHLLLLEAQGALCLSHLQGTSDVRQSGRQYSTSCSTAHSTGMAGQAAHGCAARHTHLHTQRSALGLCLGCGLLSFGSAKQGIRLHTLQMRHTTTCRVSEAGKQVVVN